MVALAPTGVGAGMAGGTQRLRLDEQGIVIAIGHYFLYQQMMAALLAFCPQPLFAAAEKSHFSFGHCLFQGFIVHKPHHQHFVGEKVLDDGRHQAVAVFFEIYFHDRQL
jgi:hypothetical protein